MNSDNGNDGAPSTPSSGVQTRRAAPTSILKLNVHDNRSETNVKPEEANATGHPSKPSKKRKYSEFLKSGEQAQV